MVFGSIGVCACALASNDTIISEFPNEIPYLLCIKRCWCKHLYLNNINNCEKDGASREYMHVESEVGERASKKDTMTLCPVLPSEWSTDSTGGRRMRVAGGGWGRRGRGWINLVAE